MFKFCLKNKICTTSHESIPSISWRTNIRRLKWQSTIIRKKICKKWAARAWQKNANWLNQAPVNPAWVTTCLNFLKEFRKRNSSGQDSWRSLSLMSAGSSRLEWLEQGRLGQLLRDVRIRRWSGQREGANPSTCKAYLEVVHFIKSSLFSGKHADTHAF